MPATLTVAKIETPPGSYGNVYEDVTRPGLSSVRLILVGVRGDAAQVTVMAFHTSASAARAFVQTVENAVGHEVYLVSPRDLIRWQGVIQEAPKVDDLVAVQGTNSSVTHMTRLTFPFVRSAGVTP